MAAWRRRKLMKEKRPQSLRDKRERLDKKEQEAMDEMQTAEVSYRLPYLQVQNQVDSEGAKVACLMTDTAKAV